MKTLPTALATHYAGGTTTLADLLKITRKDGQVFAFTSASTDVTIASQLYTSAQGLDISSLEVTAGLAVDNLELTTLDDGTIFSRVEVLAGVWRNADFIISRYNWASPGDGIEVRMVGTVGEVHLKRGSITAELRGLQQYLQQPIGSVTSKTCRARLGDALCRVNMTGYTVAGTVTSVESQQAFTDAAITGDTHYASVIALLNFNGANGSTSFVDQGPLAKTYTRINTPTISTAQSKFGGSSFFKSNVVSNNYIRASSVDLTLPGDLTAECFTFVTSTTPACVFALGGTPNSAQEATIFIDAGRFNFYMGGTFRITGPTISLNTWYHLALTRSAGVWRLFVDGVPYGPYTNATALNDGFIIVGARNTTTASFGGYVDSFRVTKGLVRYADAGFAPPASQFPAGGAAYPDEYFSNGLLTWVSGANAGLQVQVKRSDSGGFVLALPMVSAIAPGDTFSIVAGCRKRLEDCSGKFNNVLNFQGEPHLPGVDQITAPA